MGILKQITSMGGLALASKALKKKEPAPAPAPKTYAGMWDQMEAADRRAQPKAIDDEDSIALQEAQRIKKMRMRRLGYGK